jgi:hypothetical protein
VAFVEARELFCSTLFGPRSHAVDRVTVEPIGLPAKSAYDSAHTHNQRYQSNPSGNERSGKAEGKGGNHDREEPCGA